MRSLQTPSAFLLLLSFFFFGMTASAQVTCAQATLITNGSFDGSIGVDVTAPGWTSLSTPDLNDHLNPVQTTPSYTWTGTPLESADGGTWQNVYGVETISQSIECTIGSWYELKYEYAAQGISAPGIDLVGPFGVLVSFNGVQEFFSPADETQYTWETESYIFQATESTIEITFQASADQYLGLDGVCVIPTSEPTGIETPENTLSMMLSVYPNPASKTFTLSGFSAEDARIVVFDANGKVVIDMNSNGAAQKTIDSSALESGLYLVRVEVGEEFWTDRLVIQ